MPHSWGYDDIKNLHDIASGAIPEAPLNPKKPLESKATKLLLKPFREGCQVRISSSNPD